MANHNDLKTDIRQYIYSNQNEEITGNILRDVLLEMVDTLGDGWTYKGVATTTANPGTPDSNVFYIATAPGTYTNFKNSSNVALEVADGEVAILKYNGSWAKDVTGAATSAQVTQLGQEVNTNKTNITNLQQEIDDIQPIIIEGNVTNAPDEEDITTDSNDLLKFADRPTAVNQMGYVILRKNKTFAEQVTQENTIYEIRYDFTLAANFTMPAGCVLLFNGGSISGAYNFTGNKTGIVAPIKKIFETNITIAGTWDVAEVFPIWFGAVGDGVADDTLAIKNCFNIGCPTILRGNYIISNSIRVYNSIIGQGSSIIYNANCYLYFQDMADFFIESVKIDGKSLSQSGIRFSNVQDVTIRNCTIENIGNQNIAQASALLFMTSTNCKNAYIQGCKIKNVVYDGSGACSGIGFSSNAGDTETANNGLYVYDCRFEGFNTSAEDSDCIKILSDNGLNTNVVISGCFFTGIGKRAVKTQAIGVKLIGNTYEVVTPTYTVVAFQRGGCESLNDTLIVNPADGETSEYLVANVFELGYGNIQIHGFNTIVKNYVQNVNGSHMMFCYIGGYGSTTFDGLRITNCVVGHCGFLLRFVAETTCTNILVDNVMFKNPASFHNRLFISTPTGITNSKFENIGRLNKFNPLTNIDFSKIFNCSFILDSDAAGFGGSNTTTDNGNIVKITYPQASSNVECVEYAMGRIVKAYLTTDTNPSGLGSSRWGVLRDVAATIGTILYKKTPSISQDGTKMEMGYILKSQSGSAVGTAVVYSIPLQ